MTNSHTVRIIGGRGKVVQGEVCIPDRGDVVNENSIIIIPHGGADYHVAGLTCKGIITEIGNQLCHLAIVTREMKKPLVAMPGAIVELMDVQRVIIDCEEGKVLWKI